jgi:hypothetical protein
LSHRQEKVTGEAERKKERKNKEKEKNVKETRHIRDACVP